MIKGHHRGASPCDMPCTSSTAGSQSETDEPDRKKSRWQPCTSEQWLKDSSGRPENSNDKGVINLPNEVVVKILSNLDIRTVSACRHVSKGWKALIDENHLPALSFCRGLHYRTIPQAVKDYHSSTRDWLTGFGDEGKKLVEELDKHLKNKYFPAMLFLTTAKVLARAKILTCQNISTVQPEDGAYVYYASFSANGHELVTATLDGTAKIWRFVDGQWQEKDTIKHGEWLHNASLSPDGHHLVTVSRDHTVKAWRFVDGQWQENATSQFKGWMSNGSPASFSPDGRRLVTVSSGTTATIWKLVADQWQEEDIIHHNHSVRSASFSPDGHQLVTASWDKTVKTWEPVNGQWQEKAKIDHDKPVRSASFSPDGHQLVTVSTDNTAITWRLVDDQWQKKTTIKQEKVTDASFSPDGHHLVTVSMDHTVNIWEPVDGVTAQNLLANREKTPLQPGKTQAEKAENDDLPVKNELLPDRQWKKKATIRHDSWVFNASCSPDGRHLVTTSDSTAKIWLLKSRGEESQER